MIRSWLARRRLQKLCPHPREVQVTEYVEGASKFGFCPVCDKRRRIA